MDCQTGKDLIRYDVRQIKLKNLLGSCEQIGFDVLQAIYRA